MNQRNLKGYSLVEISIVLVVIGLLGFVSIKFLSKIGTHTLNQQFKNDLERADSAITGFIYSNSRLPCPDTNQDGLEDCGLTSLQGALPINTLGIESTIQKKRGGLIRYAVYRKANTTLTIDTDLAQLKDRYEPLLPNSETSTQSNGLDFCLSLKTAALGTTDTTQVNIGSTSINVAYAIADSGTIDANNDGFLFDGTNAAGVKFEKPNTSHLNNYDDNVLAIGFNELSGRLNCAKVLAQTNGAARASYAAYDMWLVSTQYKNFRDFNVHFLEIMKDIADTKVALAIAGEAIAALGVALAVVVGAETAGAAAVVIGLAAVAFADATAALVLAVMDQSGAADAVTAGILQRSQATTALTNATIFKDSKLLIVKSLDQRGLIR